MMNSENYFCHISSSRIADLISKAHTSICYAAPGIQNEPAQAIVELTKRLGPEMVTITLDFNEDVMRMGYGDIDSVKLIRDSGVVINHSSGLRSALIIIDDEGYTYTPNALLLEGESEQISARNAMKLSKEQVAEAQARLSPAAKIIAVAQAKTDEEKERIQNLEIDVESKPISDSQVNFVDEGLQKAQPVKFDLARQVRVFTAYLQYVEIELTGASIQKRKLPIPKELLNLGGSKELSNRLHTQFDLIEKDDKLSSKGLEDQLRELRNDFAPSLGKENGGRVILKSAIELFNERLARIKEDLEEYQEALRENLQEYLDHSKDQVIEYYLPLVKESPPDKMKARMVPPYSDAQVRSWISRMLSDVFPSADTLVGKMSLDVNLKDVTFATLNKDSFFESVRNAFPEVNWDKAYSEYKAAGESKSN